MFVWEQPANSRKRRKKNLQHIYVRIMTKFYCVARIVVGGGARKRNAKIYECDYNVGKLKAAIKQANVISRFSPKKPYMYSERNRGFSFSISPEKRKKQKKSKLFFFRLFSQLLDALTCSFELYAMHRAVSCYDKYMRNLRIERERERLRAPK